MKFLAKFFLNTLNIPFKLVFIVGLIYLDYYLVGLAANAINQKDDFHNLVGALGLMEIAYCNLGFFYHIIKISHDEILEEIDQ